MSSDFQVREVARAHARSPDRSGCTSGSAGQVTSTARADGVAGLDAAILQTRVLDRLPRAPAAGPVWSRACPRRPPDELTQRCDADGGACSPWRRRHSKR